MDFELTEDQRMIRQMVREFAEEKIRPGALRRDEEGAFVAELLPGLAELGLLGMASPEEYGGSGLDMVSTAIAIEELARVCASTAVTVAVTNGVCQEPILRFGNDEQKKRFLPPLARGEQLGGFALTEPGAGSDAASIKTRAVRNGGHYVLNGAKAWITNTHVGKVFVVMAVTDPAQGAKGISAFIVTSDTPGFHFLPEEKKMGLKASITSGIAIEDCKVPAENLLGKEGIGLKVALATSRSPASGSRLRPSGSRRAPSRRPSSIRKCARLSESRSANTRPSSSCWRKARRPSRARASWPTARRR